MELTGVMDDKSCSKQLPACEDTASGHFTVCDLADEEVHFWRSHSSDFYYQAQGAHPGQRTHGRRKPSDTTVGSTDDCHQHAGAPVAPAGRKASSQAASAFSSLELTGPLSPTDYQQHQQPPGTQEQVSSSRLLNTLGNKLRRGSNYFNAPTRLLGQYLLGITIQSWCEFFDSARMRAPAARHQLSRRLAANLGYFQGNYLCVSLVLVIYCILTSPLLLIALAAYLLALYLVTLRSALGKQTRVFGYRLNLQQQCSFITMAWLPPLWVAGAPSAVFWVIGASFFLVGLHASMYSSGGELQQPGAADRLAASSRAPHSLAQHTPTLLLDQRAAGPSTPAGCCSTAVLASQYYNHYPGVATPSARAPPAQVEHTKVEAGGYVSQAISHWITFGSRPRPQGAYSELSGAGPGPSPASAREPQVKIISRDYAGLGRVYEV